MADTRNNRVQVFNSEGSFKYTFGEKGSKTGQFSAPEGIVVNSQGIIYVADTGNNRIQIFNKDGIFLMSFGSKSIKKKNVNALEGTFLEPTSLAINEQDHIYVVDRGNHRIQVFDEKGKHLKTIGGFGNNLGQFDMPVDIAVDDQQYVYVAEQGNHRVQIFPPKGLTPIIFGSLGLGNACFKELTGVAIYQNKIYVTDAENENIRVYKFQKNFIQPAPKEKIRIPQRIEEISDDEEEFELR